MKTRSLGLITALAIGAAVSSVPTLYAQSESGSRSFGATVESGAKSLYHGGSKAVSDTWITSKVKEELMTDKTTKHYTIHVDTRDSGVVNLTGEVPARVADRAVDIAGNIAGVRKVNNNMQIGTGARSSR